jgi:LPS-assembly protein
MAKRPKVDTKDIVLEADSLKYRDGLAMADGNVIARKNDIIIMGDSLIYDLRHCSMEARNVKSYLHPMILTAKKISMTDMLRANDATIYFLEPDSFSPNIRAKKVVADGSRKCSVSHARIQIGKIPIFYLPKLDMDEHMFPDISSEIGVNSRHGAFVQNKVLVNVGNHVKLGGLFDVYTKSGILFGPALKYSSQDETYSVLGGVDAGFIADRGRRGVDNLGRNIKKHRFFSEVRHKQHIYDSVDVTGQLSWLRDSEVERDFRRRIHNKNRYADSFAEVVYKDDWYLLSAIGQFRPNDFYPSVERFPQLRFDTVTMQLPWMGLYHNFFAEVARLRDKSVDVKNILTRFDSYYGLYRPTHLTDYMTVTPVIGGRFTCYDRTLSSKDSYQRVIGQVGVDVEFFGHGFIGYDSDLLDMHGIKHVIKPMIQYRYTPNAAGGSSLILPMDRHHFDTNIPTLDLGDMRDVDQLKAGNIMRLGLENLFFVQGRSNYLARKIAELSVYQDVRLGHYGFDFDTNGRHSLSDSYIKLELSPFDFIGFKAYSRINPNRATLNELTTATEFKSGDLWRIDFSTKTLQHELDQYGIGFAWNFNAVTSAKISARFDARTKKLTEHEYFISTMIGNSWKCEFGVTIKNGSSREAKFQPGFRVELMKW